MHFDAYCAGCLICLNSILSRADRTWHRMQQKHSIICNMSIHEQHAGCLICWMARAWRARCWMSCIRAASCCILVVPCRFSSQVRKNRLLDKVAAWGFFRLLRRFYLEDRKMTYDAEQERTEGFRDKNMMRQLFETKGKGCDVRRIEMPFWSRLNKSIKS